MRHGRGPRRQRASRRARRADLPLLLRPLPERIPGQSRDLRQPRHRCCGQHRGRPRARACAWPPPARRDTGGCDVRGRRGRLEWTCPMHPEIRRPGPGACPICGMALEPVTVTADSGPSPELADMTRRFWVGVVLSIPVLVLGMGGDLFPALHDLVSREGVHLDPAGAGDPGGAVGRLAVLRARLDLGPDAEAEHVHADRDGHRRRLAVQRGRHRRARHLSRRVPAWTARSTSTSRPPRSSPPWSCSVRCWSCAPASRPPGRSAPCSTSTPKTAHRINADGTEDGGHPRPGPGR